MSYGIDQVESFGKPHPMSTASCAAPLPLTSQCKHRRSRDGHQPKDRQGARPRRTADAARPRRRGHRMSAPGKLVRSSRWKTGPSKGQRPLGSECCVTAGDSGHEAYTAIAWGVGLSHERSDIAGAEGFHSLEGNMCGTAMRGADALPGSKATSRAKGSHRNLGDLASGRRCHVFCAEYGGMRDAGRPAGAGTDKIRTGG